MKELHHQDLWVVQAPGKARLVHGTEQDAEARTSDVASWTNGPAEYWPLTDAYRILHQDAISALERRRMVNLITILGQVAKGSTLLVTGKAGDARPELVSKDDVDASSAMILAGAAIHRLKKAAEAGEPVMLGLGDVEKIIEGWAVAIARSSRLGYLEQMLSGVVPWEGVEP
ncbi:hypothetical protein CcrJ4_gp433 [Caulobacter phage J4]|nr:hypothetical protein CcrJ4_gp433 [Caulobacter phage J4]